MFNPDYLGGGFSAEFIDVTISGDLTVNGDFNFGDASTDNLTVNGTVIITDDNMLALGSDEDYWFEYNSSGTQFEFWTSDGDGGGTDLKIFTVSDGAIGLDLAENLTVGGTVTVDTLTASQLVKTDASKVLTSTVATIKTEISFEVYDASPARASVSDIHGSLLSLATAQPLNTVPTDLVVIKGIGKLLIVINAGSDIAGDITVTGDSIDRNTGAKSISDTDTITVDALTTDGSDTDGNGNPRHSFTGAYITNKWFTGTVTLSTADLTLTDVDVYHVSFEQFNDEPILELRTFDINCFTTSTNAEIDAYLYTLEVTGDKCNIERTASLNIGTDGETAIANKYWRLRRGNIGKTLDGTTDGVWVELHYANNPALVTDMNMKVWAQETTSLILT